MNKPFWVVLWVFALEALIIAVLIPGDWTKRVIQQESVLIEKRLGAEEQRWIKERADRWYHRSVIKTGVYSAVLAHLTPTDDQRERSVGMQDMGSGWFQWAEGRLNAVANAYYHILSRFALLLTWAPYFIILLVPASYDGYVTWRIKRNNFQYSSPLIHQYSTMGIGWILIGLAILFMAPIIIEPILIPVSIMLICVMFGLMIGNLQKRV